MDWKKQGANLAEVGTIAWDLLKSTDWKQFGTDRVTSRWRSRAAWGCRVKTARA